MLRVSVPCLLVLALFSACKQKDQAPPPLASASSEPAAPAQAAPTAATPPADAAVQAEAAERAAPVVPTGDAHDAGRAAEDAGASDAKKLAAAGNSLKACCNALVKAAHTDEAHAHRYQAAAAVCNGLAKSVSAGKAAAGPARTTLRAQLQGISAPSGC